VVVGEIEVWRGRGYELLLYDYGGARRAIREWEQSAAAVLQCGVDLLRLTIPEEGKRMAGEAMGTSPVTCTVWEASRPGGVGVGSCDTRFRMEEKMMMMKKKLTTTSTLCMLSELA
jgi:hypothetical protein